MDRQLCRSFLAARRFCDKLTFGVDFRSVSLARYIYQRLNSSASYARSLAHDLPLRPPHSTSLAGTMIDPQLELSSRGCLPSTFMHGYSSASYQIEGGYKQDGRGLSVWDTSLRDAPLGNGNVACDSYNLWRDDIQLLKEYGANTYRFSISWSRVIPLGERRISSLTWISGSSHHVATSSLLPRRTT